MKRILAWLTALFLVGCQNSEMTPPEGGRVKISVRGAAGGGLAKRGGGDINAKNAAAVDSVTITTAQIVIDMIEFENSNEDSMDYNLAQPFVQNLVGDSTLYVVAVVNLPLGTYEEMDIEIDKLRMNDGAVYNANPQLQDLSVYARGYVNGDTTQRFVFTSALMEEQEREFSPPLVIDANTPDTNIVLMIDVNTWFVNANGYVLDPRLANNQRTIERNIRASISMYEDEDDDGDDDDGDDGDGD